MFIYFTDNEILYSKTHFGTKSLIHEFIQESKFSGTFSIDFYLFEEECVFNYIIGCN